MPPPSPTITGNVALLAAPDVRVDPLDELRIRVDRRSKQRPLVRVVLVPIVARQMLVVPGELAGVGIQRDGRIAVEIGGRKRRDRIRIAAVPRHPRVRRRIGNAPVDQTPHRIVAPGQTPRRRDARRFWCIAPRFTARLVVAGRRVELPDFLAGLRVVGRDVAVLPPPCARAPRQHLAFDDDRPGREPPAVFVSHRSSPVRASSATMKLSGAV